MSSLSHGLKKVTRKISSMIPHQHSADTRQSMYAAREQLDYYKQAKDEMHKENERLNTERTAEQDKIHKTQIRALKNKFRSRGFLGSTDEGDLKDKLG